MPDQKKPAKPPKPPKKPKPQGGGLIRSIWDRIQGG